MCFTLECYLRWWLQGAAKYWQQRCSSQVVKSLLWPGVKYQKSHKTLVWKGIPLPVQICRSVIRKSHVCTRIHKSWWHRSRWDHQRLLSCAWSQTHSCLIASGMWLSTLQPCKRDHALEEQFGIPEEGDRRELWDFIHKQQPVSVSAPETRPDVPTANQPKPLFCSAPGRHSLVNRCWGTDSPPENGARSNTPAPFSTFVLDKQPPAEEA